MTNYLLDLARRVGGAFVAALLSSIMVGAGDTESWFNLTSVNWSTALSVAAGAAILSLLKGLAAKFRASPHDASLLPPPSPPQHGTGAHG